MRVTSHHERVPARDQPGAGTDAGAHAHVSTQLGRSLLGLVFIFNSFMFGWLFPEGALASIHSLIKLTPTKARRVVGPAEEEVPVHDLAVGTPLILVIGGLVWAFTHDLNRVVTVFIVACPYRRHGVGHPEYD